MNLPDVSTLRAENIDDMPQYFCFEADEMDHAWGLIYPDVGGWEYEECQAWMLDRGLDEIPGRLEYDDDPDVLDEMRERIEREMWESEDYHPMMHYIYPILPNVDEQTGQAILDDLPVVLVSVEGQPYLALSGGGMDLSWEICEAYIRLGQLPPTHFCDLPQMADRGEDERDQQIIRACHESLRIAAQRLQYTRDRLYRTFGTACHEAAD